MPSRGLFDTLPFSPDIQRWLYRLWLDAHVEQWVQVHESIRRKTWEPLNPTFWFNRDCRLSLPYVYFPEVRVHLGNLRQ